jgi:hypothetical protein
MTARTNADLSNGPATPPDEIPVRGARAISLILYGSDAPADVKRVYAEAPNLPVFRTKVRGPLHGFPSELRQHYRKLSEAAAKRATERAAANDPVEPLALPPKTECWQRSPSPSESAPKIVVRPKPASQGKPTHPQGKPGRRRAEERDLAEA